MTEKLTPRAEVSAESTSVPLERDQLTRRERAVWRAALVILGALAVALAVISWDGVHEVPPQLEALPIGLIVLVSLFAVYAWTKTKRNLGVARAGTRH